jgi:hypothetical protein
MNYTKEHIIKLRHLIKKWQQSVRTPRLVLSRFTLVPCHEHNSITVNPEAKCRLSSQFIHTVNSQMQRSTVLLEMLQVAQLVKKFLIFHGLEELITLFKSNSLSHWARASARRVHSTLSSRFFDIRPNITLHLWGKSGSTRTLTVWMLDFLFYFVFTSK